MKALNLSNFYQQFPDEKACLEYLETMRWPTGRACPHCGSTKTYKFKSGVLFKCGDCKKQFTAKVGTIFTDTHIPLQKWFLAIYLLTSRKKGTSSVQLAKDLQITQKSAWFILHRVRYAVAYKPLDKPFETPTEGDETLVGGFHQGKRGQRDNKMVVLGIVEKQKGKGRLITKVAKEANATVAMTLIRDNVKPGTVIHTDESPIYFRLKDSYQHSFVNHRYKEYVKDGVTTNTMEGAWNHLKLGLKAIYMGVSPKHLDKYCDEFAFRYSTRDVNDGERFGEWFGNVNNKHLPYKILVG